MSKSKKWIIVACTLLGAGILICVISLSVIGFDFKKLSTVKYVTKDYDIEDDFQNIHIDADIEKIEFVPSEDKSCSVRCYEEEKNPHNVRVEGDTLKIGRKNHKWHWNLGIVMEGPEITVYLPKDQYSALAIDGDTGDVKVPGTFSFKSINVQLTTGDISCFASASGDISIETDTGDIKMEDFSASGLKLNSDTGSMDLSNVKLSGDINIKENTGDVSLENVTCGSLTSNSDTGSLVMTKVIAEKEFHLGSDTGDIEFNGCDAKTIYGKTDTGSVTGSLLTDKVFITKTDTGDVNVPTTSTGGRCEITTDTGDIRITIER